MKSLRKSEKGSSFVIVLLVVVVVAAIGLIAYRVRSNTLSSSNSNQPTVVAGPQAINSKANLQTASQALQTASIGSDLDPAQLDSSINSLL